MESLTLEQASYLAEVIGVFVVVISLVYLSVQVKQNTQAVRSTTAHQAMQPMSEWYLAISHDLQTCEIWLKGLAASENLSNEERFQFTMLVHNIFLIFQNMFYMGREHTLDKEIQHTIAVTITGVKDLPGFKQYWQQRRDVFMKDFREYMEHEVFAEKPSATAAAYKHHVDQLEQ